MNRKQISYVHMYVHIPMHELVKLRTVRWQTDIFTLHEQNRRCVLTVVSHNGAVLSQTITDHELENFFWKFVFIFIWTCTLHVCLPSHHFLLFIRFNFHFTYFKQSNNLKIMFCLLFLF
jgi:hypothetical protein